MVKLSGLVIKAEARDSAPRTVKLFTNQPSLGFSEAASERPTQEFALSEDDLAGRVLPLRRAAPAVCPQTSCRLDARLRASWECQRLHHVGCPERHTNPVLLKS